MSARHPFGPIIGARICVVGPRGARYVVPWHEAKCFHADRRRRRQWLPETGRELVRKTRSAAR